MRWAPALLGLATACLPLRSPPQLHAHVEGQARAALARADGQPALAATLARGVVAVDPGRAAELGGLCPEPDGWGANRTTRTERPAPWTRRVLLWLPDRLADLCDLLSFDVGLGVGAGADLHLTRALQLGASAGASVGVGWHSGRSLGVRTRQGRELAAGPWASGFLTGFDRGTGNARAGGAAFDGVAAPQDGLLAQEWRDPWAVGARAQLMVSLEADLHPLQLLDLLAGLVGGDPARDDLATTTEGALTRDEELGMIALREALAAPDQLEAYRRWRAGRLSPPADGP